MYELFDVINKIETHLIDIVPLIFNTNGLFVDSERTYSVNEEFCTADNEQNRLLKCIIQDS
jgi:hypothetical protein